MAPEIETILLEPNLLIREGLVRILAGTQFEVRAHASCLEELALSTRDRPTMFILAAPDQASAGEGPIAQVRREFPSAWIVSLESSNGAVRCLSALRAGANTVLTQELSAEALVRSLELVTLGVVAIPVELLRELIDQGDKATLPQPTHAEAQTGDVARLLSSGRARLSNREMNILGCIQKGDSNKLIARQYELAEATVKVHVKSILRKIGAANRTQAAIWAMNQIQPNTNRVPYPGQSDLQ